jgi:predicted ATPase
MEFYAMLDQVVNLLRKALPAEVVEQAVAKTDGVPLFVEELTKMVLESSLLQEREDRYALTGPLPPLAIPTTLHDSLMARLDRLATATRPELLAQHYTEAGVLAQALLCTGLPDPSP